MGRMKLLRFLHQGAPQWGAVETDLGAGQLPDHVRVYAGDMMGAHQPTALCLPLEGLTFLPPCQPTKVMALWNNFRAAAQRNQLAQPPEPLYFLKAANALSAHLSDVPRPRQAVGRLVYEAELGVVIGKRGRDIPLSQAAEHVLGYTCVNDVTAPELLRADPSFEQWTRAKSLDGFCPFGPYIDTEVDPQSLHVQALVNGRERQNYPVADMFFSPLELVSLLSRDVSLEPGDLICCGTSLGAGPWQDGARVEVHIEGLGTLVNTLKGNIA